MVGRLGFRSLGWRIAIGLAIPLVVFLFASIAHDLTTGERTEWHVCKRCAP